MTENNDLNRIAVALEKLTSLVGMLVYQEFSKTLTSKELEEKFKHTRLSNKDWNKKVEGLYD